MHGFAVYVKEGLPFMQELSLENCRFFLLLSTGFTSFSVLRLFYLLITLIFMQLFGSISSNIDQILLINPSADVVGFGDFNVCHKDCLTYFGRTYGPGELYYNLKHPYSSG